MRLPEYTFEAAAPAGSGWNPVRGARKYLATCNRAGAE